MKFVLEIRCDNAAFGDTEDERGYELGRFYSEEEE